jgi:hypothetical protein
MRHKFITSLFLGSLLLTLPAFYVPVRADQDDMENNADLQETPEEKAKAAVLRRWPDATEIDALDMAAEQDDADDAEAMDRKARDGDEVDAGEKDDPAPAMMGEEKEEDDDDGGNWTISVLFVSGGKKFEALTDDDGKIQYVYETIPKEDAPKNILDAALAEVNEGNIVYVQKERDETKDEAVTSYIVGVGDKDVRLDEDGKVIEVKDAPPANDEDDDDDAGGQKMRI